MKTKKCLNHLGICTALAGLGAFLPQQSGNAANVNQTCSIWNHQKGVGNYAISDAKVLDGAFAEVKNRNWVYHSLTQVMEQKVVKGKDGKDSVATRNLKDDERPAAVAMENTGPVLERLYQYEGIMNGSRNENAGNKQLNDLKEILAQYHVKELKNASSLAEIHAEEAASDYRASNPVIPSTITTGVGLSTDPEVRKIQNDAVRRAQAYRKATDGKAVTDSEKKINEENTKIAKANSDFEQVAGKALSVWLMSLPRDSHNAIAFPAFLASVPGASSIFNQLYSTALLNMDRYRNLTLADARTKKVETLAELQELAKCGFAEQALGKYGPKALVAYTGEPIAPKLGSWDAPRLALDKKPEFSDLALPVTTVKNPGAVQAVMAVASVKSDKKPVATLARMQAPASSSLRADQVASSTAGVCKLNGKEIRSEGAFLDAYMKTYDLNEAIGNWLIPTSRSLHPVEKHKWINGHGNYVKYTDYESLVASDGNQARAALTAIGPILQKIKENADQGMPENLRAVANQAEHFIEVNQELKESADDAHAKSAEIDQKLAATPGDPNGLSDNAANRQDGTFRKNLALKYNPDVTLGQKKSLELTLQEAKYRAEAESNSALIEKELAQVLPAWIETARDPNTHRITQPAYLSFLSGADFQQLKYAALANAKQMDGLNAVGVATAKLGTLNELSDLAKNCGYAQVLNPKNNPGYAGMLKTADLKQVAAVSELATWGSQAQAAAPASNLSAQAAQVASRAPTR